MRSVKQGNADVRQGELLQWRSAFANVAHCKLERALILQMVTMLSHQMAGIVPCALLFNHRFLDART